MHFAKDHTDPKPTDPEIVAEWKRLVRLAGRNRLGRALAVLEADDLDRKGVTEADIDRLFPTALTAISQQNQHN